MLKITLKYLPDLNLHFFARVKAYFWITGVTKTLHGQNKIVLILQMYTPHFLFSFSQHLHILSIQNFKSQSKLLKSVLKCVQQQSVILTVSLVTTQTVYLRC